MDPQLEEQLQHASQLAAEGLWREAFDLLREEEQRNPDDPTLLCMLGVVAGEAEVEGLAYDYFRRCLAQQPDDPELLIRAGQGLARVDDPDAEVALRLAAVTAPDNLAARLAYGSYLAREGLVELALEELGAAAEIEPQNAEVATERARAFLLGGRAGEGLEAIEHALGLLPNDADLRLLHAVALLRSDQAEEAAEELHRSAAEFSDDPDLSVLAALACAAQGWADEAWDALARAEVIEAAPDRELIEDLEEALEAGPEAAAELLQEQLVPSVLHDRLRRGG
jgi:predicted Zn-dependent protease